VVVLQEPERYWLAEHVLVHAVQLLPSLVDLNKPDVHCTQLLLVVPPHV